MTKVLVSFVICLGSGEIFYDVLVLVKLWVHDWPRYLIKHSFYVCQWACSWMRCTFRMMNLVMKWPIPMWVDMIQSVTAWKQAKVEGDSCPTPCNWGVGPSAFSSQDPPRPQASESAWHPTTASLPLLQLPYTQCGIHPQICSKSLLQRF